ncbi:hypothetical protein NQZ68_003265 [Dissostichus eleginoides]|nr:hypothetical protein NQZ68_003265 [Dissostichus eleginoides]
MRESQRNKRRGLPSYNSLTGSQRHHESSGETEKVRRGDLQKLLRGLCSSRRTQRVYGVGYSENEQVIRLLFEFCSRDSSLVSIPLTSLKPDNS